VNCRDRAGGSGATSGPTQAWGRPRVTPGPERCGELRSWTIRWSAAASDSSSPAVRPPSSAPLWPRLGPATRSDQRLYAAQRGALNGRSAVYDIGAPAGTTSG
jgi:hypothetical protein